MNEENQPTVSQSEINNIVWQACDTFRGVVDPSQYKDYILVMLFLKYLSDTVTEERETLSEKFGGDQSLIERKLDRFRFKLPEGCSFDEIYAERDNDQLGDKINTAFEQIEEANKEKLEGVFRNVDFNSESNLGQAKDRNRRLKNLLNDFTKVDLRPSLIGSADVIGNCYLYLISNFASDAGKKGGEFYTPNEVAKLLAHLVQPKSGDRICDPTCGSGGLLIEAANLIPDGDCSLYGQEINGATRALAKMNMFLHERDSADIRWGDTINNPQLIEEDKLMKFDVVVANPPFSLDKWGADEAPSDRFNRFHRGIPPKSKGDWAFISHMVETVVETGGRVGVVVPHGVLFRGSSEGVIRKKMIDENLLDAVIGLPEKLFFGAAIPASILVFKKGRERNDILFVDASREFDSGTKQNILADKYISKIFETYQGFDSIEKYSHVATREEIIENEYNLNIPRYVDTFEAETEINIQDVQKDMVKTETQLVEVQQRIKSFMRDLNLEI
jgi:type I restriction enzyme M protein